MTKKEFRILSNEELETQVQTLKEYYWVKSKAWAIKKAIRDCATVAEHKWMVSNLNKVLSYDIKNSDNELMRKFKKIAEDDSIEIIPMTTNWWDN